MAALMVPAASFKLKYKCPLEWALKLLNSPTTVIDAGNAPANAPLTADNNADTLIAAGLDVGFNDVGAVDGTVDGTAGFDVVGAADDESAPLDLSPPPRAAVSGGGVNRRRPRFGL